MKLLRKFQNDFVERRITKIVQPHTLVGPERIHNLFVLAQRIEEEQVPGDVIECGVCNGGTAAFLARSATRSRLNRTVWLLDSFQGMPPTTEHDGPAPDGDPAEAHIGKEKGDLSRVKSLWSGSELKRTGFVSFPAGFKIPFHSSPLRRSPCLISTRIGTSPLSFVLQRFMTGLCRGDSFRSMTTAIGPAAAKPWMNSSRSGRFPANCKRSTTLRTGSGKNERALPQPWMRRPISSRLGECGHVPVRRRACAFTI